MSAEPPRTRTILTKALARVEGEGAMHVRIADGEVEDVQLRIYEPPRFFEALLRGRRHTEPPDITARICGICPVAYQMSACTAVEDACGLAIDGPIRELRRLIYCGEWIESHTLHVFMLHAPDFLGYESAIEMATPVHARMSLGPYHTGRVPVGGRPSTERIVPSAPSAPSATSTAATCRRPSLVTSDAAAGAPPSDVARPAPRR